MPDQRSSSPTSADPDRRTGVFNGIFGRLLRFWRTTLGVSQEQLSTDVGVSVRHISFLENGRAMPGRAMVLDLAEALALGARDTNNLLLAAGYIPAFHAAPAGELLQSDDLRWLRNSLLLTLRGLDPVPAVAHEPSGRVVMANRAWVRWLRARGQSEMAPANGNLYRWFFANTDTADAGWEAVACGLLMNLQQEAMLSDAPEIKSLLAELEALPSVPADWQRRAVRIAYFHSFRIYCSDMSCGESGQRRGYTSVASTVGATPYVEQPRLLINALYPDGAPGDSSEEGEPIVSPLLFY
jgi:transcriptional regulator with XRE-family HTH domain